MNRFFGKYRGQVTNNKDPQQMGRIQVSVPAVLGAGRLSWAMPSVPYAGKGVGLFMIPEVDANVWVEFEGGDTDYPIWSGCFWNQGEAPAVPASAEMKVLQTGLVTIAVSDQSAAGGIKIEVPNTGARIVIDNAGIEISNGQGAKIKLNGLKVDMNEGALEVT